MKVLISPQPTVSFDTPSNATSNAATEAVKACVERYPSFSSATGTTCTRPPSDLSSRAAAPEGLRVTMFSERTRRETAARTAAIMSGLLAPALTSQTSLSDTSDEPSTSCIGVWMDVGTSDYVTRHRPKNRMEERRVGKGGYTTG